MILLDGRGVGQNFLVHVFPQCVVFLYLTVFSALSGLDLVVLSVFSVVVIVPLFPSHALS